LTEILNGLEEEEEHVSSYWMTLRKRDDNWKPKEEALDRILWRTLEETVDLSQDRLCDFDDDDDETYFL
jgi:hypothetical protein